MSTGLIYALVGALLFVVGIGSMALLPDALRRILAFNVMGSGAFLVFVGLAQRDGQPDPIPQAMVITGIVVTVAATALALALIRSLQQLSAITKPQPDTAEPPNDGDGAGDRPSNATPGHD